MPVARGGREEEGLELTEVSHLAERPDVPLEVGLEVARVPEPALGPRRRDEFGPPPPDPSARELPSRRPIAADAGPGLPREEGACVRPSHSLRPGEGQERQDSRATRNGLDDPFHEGEMLRARQEELSFPGAFGFDPNLEERKEARGVLDLLDEEGGGSPRGRAAGRARRGGARPGRRGRRSGGSSRRASGARSSSPPGGGREDDEGERTRDAAERRLDGPPETRGDRHGGDRSRPVAGGQSRSAFRLQICASGEVRVRSGRPGSRPRRSKKPASPRKGGETSGRCPGTGSRIEPSLESAIRAPHPRTLSNRHTKSLLTPLAGGNGVGVRRVLVRECRRPGVGLARRSPPFLVHRGERPDDPRAGVGRRPGETLLDTSRRARVASPLAWGGLPERPLFARKEQRDAQRYGLCWGGGTSSSSRRR